VDALGLTTTVIGGISVSVCVSICVRKRPRDGGLTLAFAHCLPRVSTHCFRCILGDEVVRENVFVSWTFELGNVSENVS